MVPVVLLTAIDGRRHALVPTQVREIVDLDAVNGHPQCRVRLDTKDYFDVAKSLDEVLTLMRHA